MARHLPLDQARLRPHLRQSVERKRTPNEVAEEGADAPTPRWKSSAGDVDYERMRGLPMIAPGVRGAQKGTDPLGEVIRRSERHSRGR